MDRDFYSVRAATKYATSDNPENDAVVARALSALSLVSEMRLLDFGCADGYFLKRLCAAVPGLHGYGIDIVEHAGWQDSETLHFAAMELPLSFADGYFDALFCSQVLEHLDDAERAVAEFSRVLRPGGRAWIAVPNGYGDMWPCFHGLQRHIDAVEGHVRHFSDRDVRSLFARHGFRVVRRRYDLFVGLYLYYRFVSYNTAVKRRLVGSFVPQMGGTGDAPKIGLPKRLAVAGMFAVLRALRMFDNCFSWFRGCQVVEVTLVRENLLPVWQGTP